MGCFHQLEVFQHQLFCHHTGLEWIVFMTVYTSYLDRLTVDQQLTAFDSYRTETDLLHYTLNSFPVGVFEFKHQGVEVRLFTAP